MLLIVLLSRNGKTAALYYLIVVGRVVSRHAYCQKVVIEWFGHAVSAEYVRMNDFDGADKDVRSRWSGISEMGLDKSWVRSGEVKAEEIDKAW